MLEIMSVLFLCVFARMVQKKRIGQLVTCAIWKSVEGFYE